MAKARLIKKQQVGAQQTSEVRNNRKKPAAKNATELVREWVEKRQQTGPSARKAFAALFAKPGIRQAA